MKQFWLTHFKFKKEDHWQVRTSAPSEMTKDAIKGNQYRDDFHVIEFKEYENLKAMADKMASALECEYESVAWLSDDDPMHIDCEPCNLKNEYRKKFGD